MQIVSKNCVHTSIIDAFKDRTCFMFSGKQPFEVQFRWNLKSNHEPSGDHRKLSLESKAISKLEVKNPVDF